MSEGLVDPEAMPAPPVRLGDLEVVAAALKKDGRGVGRLGHDVDAAWQALAGSYKAPESAVLLRATGPVAAHGRAIEDELAAVGGALLAFIDEVRPIVSRLHGMRAAARDFRAKVDGDWDGDFGDWRDNGDWVVENNRLNDGALAALTQYQEAERVCANKITALFGGTHFVPLDAVLKRPGDRAYGWGEPPKDVKTPWGAPQEHDKPWYQDVGDFGHDFALMAVTFGGDLIGAHVYGDEESWGSAGTGGQWWDRVSGNWSRMLHDIGRLERGFAGEIDENGHRRTDLSWGERWHNGKNFSKQIANALVPWQEWDDRPGYVIASGIVNVGTLLAGGAMGVSRLSKGLKDLRTLSPEIFEAGALLPPGPAPRFVFPDIHIPDKGTMLDHQAGLDDPAQLGTTGALPETARSAPAIEPFGAGGSGLRDAEIGRQSLSDWPGWRIAQLMDADLETRTILARFGSDAPVIDLTTYPIDPGVVREINRALRPLVAEYPSIWPKLSFIRSLNFSKNFPLLEGGGLAMSMPPGEHRGIFFSAQAYIDRIKSWDFGLEMELSGWNVRTSGGMVEATFNHELGHQFLQEIMNDPTIASKFAQLLNETLYPHVPFYVDLDSEGTYVAVFLMREMGRVVPFENHASWRSLIRSKSSQYGEESLDEAVAEAFSEYRLNEHPRRFALEVGSFIDRYWHE
ncbi:hypothetical protein E1293_10770 [Actinomadura darangshiensis]|uniref:Uncharacterized protein n=1 Tax=Actinomadura darangshiensis TaxID=705336 RepID=A0A4R5BJR7_9ACTN|nr:hypothetical protein [Actinomadura darangshiensis]TDD85583.1 hypothetical protein E1293_10770 [Actinomadura darangshiensis]